MIKRIKLCLISHLKSILIHNEIQLSLLLTTDLRSITHSGIAVWLCFRCENCTFYTRKILFFLPNYFLKKRYMKAMDQKVQLSDRIEHLEHTNVQLESETETIGEYITLYQNQRSALKKKFEEKDQVIHQISAEHSRMQVRKLPLIQYLHNFFCKKLTTMPLYATSLYVRFCSPPFFFLAYVRMADPIELLVAALDFHFSFFIRLRRGGHFY